MSIPGQCKNATQVKLLTYQALPASCLLPECEFQRHLTNGVSVAHLADLVRLRALKAHGGGWFLDCNTVWVKAAPDSVTFELGHCVGSLHAARRRGSAGSGQTLLDGQLPDPAGGPGVLGIAILLSRVT